MKQLRQRRQETSPLQAPPLGGALTRIPMMQASPQECGRVEKLHIPLFYQMLPTWLARCFSAFFRPRWRSRYLILLGSYLYKFSETGNNKNEIKGSPIPLATISSSILGVEELARMYNISAPTGCSWVLCLRTLTKTQYYAVKDREHAVTWMNSLNQSKEEAVKRSMGHAVKHSYPQSWTYYDELGKRAEEKKNRLKKRLQEHQELEMSQLLGGASGSARTGYYS